MKKVTKFLSMLLLALAVVLSISTGGKMLADIDPPIGNPEQVKVVATIDPPIGNPSPVIVVPLGGDDGIDPPIG